MAGSSLARNSLVTDGQGLPLALDVSAGQAHESRWVTRLLNAVRIPRPLGRPRQRPEALAGDCGYSYDGIRTWLRRHKIRGVIPERADHLVHHPDHPRPLDPEAYRQGNVIERRVGWFKERRRMATRYEKLARHFLAVLKLAVLQVYLRLRFADTA